MTNYEYNSESNSEYEADHGFEEYDSQRSMREAHEEGCDWEEGCCTCEGGREEVSRRARLAEHEMNMREAHEEGCDWEEEGCCSCAAGMEEVARTARYAELSEYISDDSDEGE